MKGLQMAASCRYARVYQLSFDHRVLLDVYHPDRLILTCELTSATLQCISKRLGATARTVKCSQHHRHYRCYPSAIAGPYRLAAYACGSLTKIWKSPWSQASFIAAHPLNASVINATVLRPTQHQCRSDSHPSTDQIVSDFQKAVNGSSLVKDWSRKYHFNVVLQHSRIKA